MCGIVGYITAPSSAGTQTLPSSMMRALNRLRTRGYDSAGAAVVRAGTLVSHKYANEQDGTPKNGSVDRLVASVIAHTYPTAPRGIAHTRWASYGGVTVANTHPHTSNDGTIALVHNGHLNNCETLRAELVRTGSRFVSETDSEVIAELIARELGTSTNLYEAVIRSVARLDGTYGLVVMSTNNDEPLVLVSHGSPLHIGKGDCQGVVVTWVASEDHALTGLVLETMQVPKESVVAISPNGDVATTAHLEHYTPLVHDPLSTVRGNGHAMYTEIQVQPQALENCLRGRIDAYGNVVLGALDMRVVGLRTLAEMLLSKERELDLSGQGTSYYAALNGAHMIEALTGIRAECLYAADYAAKRSRSAARVSAFLSQSGETADTRDAQLFAKSCGSLALGITNRVGSTIDRDSSVGIHLRAGLEIAVASTKAFTAQGAVLALFALGLAQRQHKRTRDSDCMERLAREVAQLPAFVAETLAANTDADKLTLPASATRCMFLGRDGTHALAGEAALKMQEVAYVDAHVFHVSELKHGPLALVEPGTPVFCFVPEDGYDARAVASLRHAHARGAAIYTIGSHPLRDIEKDVAAHYPVAACHQLLFPIVAAPVVQLLSYHTGVARGNNVDEPRNLAKSVTV